MNLPNEIIRHIIHFLHNEDIFNIYKTCNIHKKILDDKVFIHYLNHRHHPIVF